MHTKKPTVRDIARDAGSLYRRLSRFLNQDFSCMGNATKQRIHEAVLESCYVNLKAWGSRTAAIVIPNITDPFSPWPWKL